MNYPKSKVDGPPKLASLSEEAHSRCAAGRFAEVQRQVHQTHGCMQCPIECTAREVAGCASRDSAPRVLASHIVLEPCDADLLKSVG